jgi:hypothetical protein
MRTERGTHFDLNAMTYDKFGKSVLQLMTDHRSLSSLMSHHCIIQLPINSLLFRVLVIKLLRALKGIFLKESSSFLWTATLSSTMSKGYKTFI